MFQPSQPALLRLMVSAPQPVSFQPTKLSICKLRWEGLQAGVEQTCVRRVTGLKSRNGQNLKDDLLKAATHLACV